MYKKYIIYYKDIFDWVVMDEDITDEYYGGEDGTYKYTKTIDRRDDTTGWRKINNKWNNEQIKNGEETTNDVGLFNKNKRDTSASGQYNIEINRNKKNEGLEESSSFNLQNKRDIQRV